MPRVWRTTIGMLGEDGWTELDSLRNRAGVMLWKLYRSVS